MKTAKIIAVAVVGATLFVGSLASAQYYNQYGYQYPTYEQPYQTYDPYQYQYPAHGYGYGAAACPNLYTNLTVGSRGTQVSELQRFLAARYGDYRLTGGYYGPLTAQYVAQFQREQGVYPATGGVGPLTRAAIARVCGGYTPGYPTYPGYPTTPSSKTFRLDRNFTLYPGESAQEYRGELTITLNSIDGGQGTWPYYYRSNPDEVRITLGESCAPGRYCAALWYPQRSYTLEEGDRVTFMDYEVRLVELERDRATFRIEEDEDNDDDDATINVTAPRAGQVAEQGDELEIEWTLADEPNQSAVILELYEDNDRRIGTIAIVDSDEDSYEWDVPERGDFCTQQYPNGLCGHDLEGDYYIKATLVEGNGFSGGRELDEDDSPEFEIED